MIKTIKVYQAKALINQRNIDGLFYVDEVYDEDDDDFPEIKALDYKNRIWSTKSKVNKINRLSFCTSYTEVLGTRILTDSLNRVRHLKIDNCIPLKPTKEAGLAEAIDLMPFGDKNVMNWN